MQNILKYIFNKNMLKFYFVNLVFADPVYLAFVPMGMFAISIFSIQEKADYVGVIVWLSVLLAIMIGRLFVLPILYDELLLSELDEHTKFFLHNLRYSTKTKILMLIIAPIPLMIVTGFGYGNSNMFEYFIFIYGLSFISGLLGSYVVLFLYWYILDRKKKIKNTEIIKKQ